MGKTYNTISTFVSGAILTAAQMNGIGTNVNNYRVPPACRITRTATQSINSATDTLIAFTAGADFDTEAPSDPMFSSGTNTTMTIRTAGLYQVSFGVVYATNTTGTRFAGVRLGGSATHPYEQASAGTPGDVTLSGSLLMSLSVGNALTLNVYQTSGGALNVNYATLSAAWVGQVS